MLLIGQDVVLVKVTHNVAVDDVFKYFTDNRCQGYGSVICLHKLKFYGVDGTTLAWISSFLSSRKQLVLLDGVKSSEKAVLSGVPQGTILGPLLFLSFINDLPDVTTSSDAHLFADDCLLYRHVNSQNDSDLLQKDLSALGKWEEEWQMSFHPQKCTVIRLATNQRHVIPTDSGSILECRSSHCRVSRSFDWFGAVSEVSPDETHCPVSLGNCVVNVLGPL
jgi:hypothetical protein